MTVSFRPPSRNFSGRGCLSLCKLALLFATSAAITGCDAFGPNNLRGTHPLYNEAIVASMNEQLVLNIVRTHYRDPLFFLDVASVTATMKLDMSAGLDQSEIGLNGGSDLIKYSFGAAYTTAPTISYAPLQGEGFVKSVLSPIPIETLFSLSASGWSAHRVFGICVERINGIENAPSASGPTPRLAPDQNRQFARLLQLIEEVARKQLIIPRIDPQTKEPQLEIKNSTEFRNQIREIKELLGLDQNLQIYRVNSDFMQSPDTISIRTRSLTGIFFYLSQHVATPQSHKTAGLVTVTHNKDGSEFDWGITPAGSLFRIRESEDWPDSAFIAIPYRGRWFYLADNDLESKSTFMLLMQLFRLQAGTAKSIGPALTIPVR
jgi:hypothetical protein